MDSSASSAPDLTQRAPRSPRLRLGGYVLLPRILDKGRALLAGKLGEYKHSAQGMNRHFFNFTGVQFEAFMAELANDKRDGEMLAWVQANSPSPRQPWEIAARRSASTIRPGKTSRVTSICSIWTISPASVGRPKAQARAGLA